MDECWLDVSSHVKTGMAIAEEIRKATREELGLTVSIGVSFNKIFAKLGSDMKKPDAITEITKENFKDKVWPLKASEMIYVGPATTKKLNSRCIYTIGELADCNPELLERWFGINGIQLWRYANGTDESRVMHKDFISPIKSIGHGITCTADLISEDDVWKVMLQLTQDIGHKLHDAIVVALNTFCDEHVAISKVLNQSISEVLAEKSNIIPRLEMAKAEKSNEIARLLAISTAGEDVTAFDERFRQLSDEIMAINEQIETERSKAIPDLSGTNELQTILDNIASANHTVSEYEDQLTRLTLVCSIS